MYRKNPLQYLTPEHVLSTGHTTDQLQLKNRIMTPTRIFRKGATARTPPHAHKKPTPTASTSFIVEYLKNLTT